MLNRVTVLAVSCVWPARRHPVGPGCGILGPRRGDRLERRQALFVANADARQIAVVDVATGNVICSIPMPAEPTAWF